MDTSDATFGASRELENLSPDVDWRTGTRVSDEKPSVLGEPSTGAVGLRGPRDYDHVPSSMAWKGAGVVSPDTTPLDLEPSVGAAQEPPREYVASLANPHATIAPLRRV